MSLIAFNNSHNMPFLFSDLLWSSAERPESIELPTNAFDLTPHLDIQLPYHPSALAQKMYIVKGKVCIEFAGYGNEIKEFLKEFTLRCKYFDDDVHIDRMHEFLDEYPFAEKFAHSKLCLVHVTYKPGDPKVHLRVFTVPKIAHQVTPDLLDIKSGVWNILQTDVYGTVYACASGTQRYLNLINQRMEMRTIAAKGSLDYAVEINCGLIAQLLTLERTSLYTVNHLWGGGFEAAYFNGEQFEKIGNLAYVINHGEFDPTGDVGIPKPKLVLFYRYFGRLLHITRIEIDKGEAHYSEDAIRFVSYAGKHRVKPIIVPPIDRQDSEADPTIDLSFKTNTVAMGYSLVTSKNTQLVPSLFKYGSHIFIDYQEGVKIEIIIHPGYINEIRLAAKAVFPNLMK